jgi:23S rRNA (uracil1939-C5)-methyltransferase
MSQPNAKNEVTLDIDALSYGPYGIGRIDGRVLMVPQTAPGDKIVARVVEAKERFSIGEAVRVISASPARRAAPCPYIRECGGCPWQHLSYKTQLAAKQQSVDDALRRIGKLSGYDLRPIIPAAQEYNYRRRIRLQVGQAREVGFYGPSSHRLVKIDACLIAGEQLNRIMETVRRWLRGISTEIEQLELVTGDDRNQIVVVARTRNGFEPGDDSACVSLIGMGPGIQGLVISGDNWHKVWGEPRIVVRPSADLNLILDADVFTQVNPEGNRRILEEILKAGDFQPADRVLELYSGAGNFTLAIARKTEGVLAVEGQRACINNGKLNAQKNGINNIRWVCAPVPKAVGDLKRRGDKFSKIVLDPPRAGAKGIEADLAALGAGKIFYISCNPATLARDLAALDKLGYKLSTVQPIDLFPQTFHVETLAVLEHKN